MPKNRSLYYLSRPDQRIQISKEVEYKDKDATREVQVADMPALYDSLRFLSLTVYVNMKEIFYFFNIAPKFLIK